MTTEEVFWKTMADDPHDHVCRQVFADYLEEDGRQNAATFVREASWTGCPLELLLGKVVKRLSVIDNEYVYFETDGDPLLVYAAGDCCSYSWFECIDGAEHLVGHRVVGFIDAPTDWMPVKDSSASDTSECIQTYCVGVVTLSGVCRMGYVNSSNGYYGGYLVPSVATPKTPGEEVTSMWGLA